MPKRSLSREEFVRDLGHLVGFETVSGKGIGLNEAMAFVQDHLDTRAYVDLIQPYVPPKDSEEKGNELILLASNSDTKTPDICYLVHMDVVPAKPNQFKMRVEGPNAVGRGTSDMK